MRTKARPGLWLAVSAACASLGVWLALATGLPDLIGQAVLSFSWVGAYLSLADELEPKGVIESLQTAAFGALLSSFMAAMAFVFVGAYQGIPRRVIDCRHAESSEAIRIEHDRRPIESITEQVEGCRRQPWLAWLP